MILAIDLDDRRHRAGEEAIRRFQRDLPLAAGFLRRDAESLRDAGEQLAATEKRARDARADAHVMTAVRRSSKLGVVGGDAVHLAGRDAKVRGHLEQCIVGEPAARVLHRLERGKEPLTLAWKAREERIERFDYEGWGG